MWLCSHAGLSKFGFRKLHFLSFPNCHCIFVLPYFPQCHDTIHICLTKSSSHAGLAKGFKVCVQISQLVFSSEYAFPICLAPPHATKGFKFVCSDNPNIILVLTVSLRDLITQRILQSQSADESFYVRHTYSYVAEDFSCVFPIR